MDLKIVQKLIQMMERGGVHELELVDPKEGIELRLKRGADPAPAPPMPYVQWMHSGAPPAMPMAPAAAPAPSGGGGQAAAAPAAPQGTTITSPMVGTFYRSSNPEAEPFVRVGTKLSVDQTLCIIEAMKVMNEIRAEISGEILQVLVENGEPVEFGQPLFLVKPH
ncbi:MAG: acetyl-CoA carboxylase biotin carboxyl carrier protein [Planctomycetes bacterium]|nr:acetyl-CoA carboxylase biotin carboxyl carrier protein [Planctomycetota bacterium]